MNHSTALLELMSRVKRGEEFAPLREYLEGRLNNTRDRLISLVDDRQLRVEQGFALALKEILDLIETSDKRIDKARAAARIL